MQDTCVDNPYFANCKLIVKARYCGNKYYAKFCCRSCTLAGDPSTLSVSTYRNSDFHFRTTFIQLTTKWREDLLFSVLDIREVK